MAFFFFEGKREKDVSEGEGSEEVEV
jgi:hypothetical protein